MPETETLLIVLQFLALVAPALAILMRLIAESGKIDTFSFNAIGISFIFIIIASYLILTVIWYDTENVQFQIVLIPIYFALIFWLFGIIFYVSPLSDLIGQEIGHQIGFFQFANSLVQAIVLGLVSSGILAFAGYLIHFFEESLTVGIIASTDGLEFSHIYLIVCIIILFRVGIFLLRVGSFPIADLGDSIRDVFVTTFAFIAGIFTLGLLPLILIKIIFSDFGFLIEISETNPVYNVGWFWNFIIILMLIAIRLEEEKEKGNSS